MYMHVIMQYLVLQYNRLSNYSNTHYRHSPCIEGWLGWGEVGWVGVRWGEVGREYPPIILPNPHEGIRENKHDR